MLDAPANARSRGLIVRLPYTLVPLLLAALPAHWSISAEGQATSTESRSVPNIVLILADDLGWGDVRCYDPEHAVVPTPNMDALAAEGMRFTDAHASGALCSPSRYGLLTGRYSWRTPMRSHVVRQYGSPLIPQDRLTLAALLAQHGYHTACIGKWHLGWDWPLRQADGTIAYVPGDAFIQERSGSLVHEETIGGGPTTRGFVEYFGVDLPNLPPYTFIRNDRMVTPPTDWKTGHDRVRWGSEGPMAPDWQFDQVLSALVDEMERHIAARAPMPQPFFLFLSLTSPHEPVAPSAPFRNRSGISDVADFIMETDAAVGRVVAALAQHELSDNTLVVVTSDNGPSGYLGVGPFRQRGHRPGGPFRGYKCNISEGGHRVPMIVRWPGIVSKGARSDQLVCLTDWMATCAAIVGATLPDDAGEDSVSMLPLLQGRDVAAREDLVVHSYFADVLAIRQGPWKLSLCSGDGVDRRWCAEEGVPQDLPDAEATNRGFPSLQLYQVEQDPGETRNLQGDHPEIVSALIARLGEHIERGRSTPGAPQRNDVPIAPPVGSGVEPRSVTDDELPLPAVDP